MYVWSRLLTVWRNRSLAMEFAFAAALIFGVGMLGSTAWVNSLIRQTIAEQTSSTTAIFMQTLVEEEVQNLIQQPSVSSAARTRLLDILNKSALGKHVVSLKIWQLDGTILFATNPELIGQKFPLEGALLEAVHGERRTEFDELSASENISEKNLGIPLLEVYVPIYESNTEHQLAVAEMYIAASQLKKNLDSQTMRNWLFMGAFTASLLVLLWSIAKRADSTIKRQQQELELRVQSLSSLLEDNARLGRELQEASRSAVTLNDRYLRKLGADLHDGPGQLLALSLIQLDNIFPKTKSRRNDAGRTALQKTLKDSMKDLRNIAAGLALPEIQNMSCSDVVRFAAEMHEARTETKVMLDIHELPLHIANDIKEAAFRFVQECLNNAFRHAGGFNQRVEARVHAHDIEIRVSDGGSGTMREEPATKQLKLGLAGLKHRMIALGGTLSTSNRTDGFVVTATIPLVTLEKHHG